MANGILKVQQIETSSGSDTITLGQSGETLQLGSGVTSKFNEPAFSVSLTSNQAISDNTATKIQFDNTILDTANAWDGTNYRWIPGVLGRYYIYARARSDAGNDNNQIQYPQIRKNGSDSVDVTSAYWNMGSTARADNLTREVSGIVQVNTITDYFEYFISIDDTSGSPSIIGNSGHTFTNFYGYRIGAS